jgi:hypothetical protein
MIAWRLTLLLLPDLYAICRLSPDAPIPDWAHLGPFVSHTRNRDELSIVCSQIDVPTHLQAERDWRCLKVEGPFDLDDTVGVLAALAAPLAAAKVSVFAISTFDTDYLLVQDKNLVHATEALEAAGHRIEIGGIVT